MSAALYDAIVVGGGHNGLVTAAYLGQAGWRVLVLERRDLVGGACVTEPVFPGYRVSTAAYVVSLLQERVVRDLDLPRFGYRVIPKDPAYFAPYLDGRHLFMYGDQRRTCDAIAAFSRRDAERYPAYEAFVERVARFVEPMLLQAPPNLPPRSPTDLLGLAHLGLRLARMRPNRLSELARMFTSSARAVLEDWFESDALKVALATDGVIGSSVGPAAPGTAYVLLHHVMGGVGGVRGLWGFVPGGMGTLSEAIASSARAVGVDIRTGVEVDRIRIHGGRATGVVLRDGSELAARVVVSNADPRRTFFGLVGREALPPPFAAMLDGFRSEGASFKLNLALGELPSYTALPGTTLGPQHRGTTHICPSMDALERAADDAKYGATSREPLLEITIPTAYDASLAPPGKHILSLFVQYAPYRLRDTTWVEEKPRFIQRVIDVLARYAPNVPNAIERVHSLSPLDLEQEYGLTGGNIFHGDLSLNQLFSLRPVAGWARYATPIRGLFLCGSGTHPGGGVTGAPGHNAARVILGGVAKRF